MTSVDTVPQRRFVSRLSSGGPRQLAVTTKVPEPPAFFDQGLRLIYAFKHSEALRAFKEAARLDPGNAMAHLGWALVLGPNLDLPMQLDVAVQTYRGNAWGAVETSMSQPVACCDQYGVGCSIASSSLSSTRMPKSSRNSLSERDMNSSGTYQGHFFFTSLAFL